MKIFRGINWIADNASFAPKEKEAKWMHHKNNDIKIAEILKKNYPVSNLQVSRGTKDVEIEFDDKILFATHPRPYGQWIYDCLKSDIVILASKSEREKAKARFNKEKARSLLIKQTLEEKLNIIKPVLERMHDAGLIDAVIGRGSYFEKNGYPIQRDDIDILLIKLEGNEEALLQAIKDVIASSSEKFRANLVWHSEIDIKRGPKSWPEFSFKLVLARPKSGKRRALGIFYEKYVLRQKTGIAIKGISKEYSERLSLKVTPYIGKDIRKKEIQKGRLTIFPKKAK
ncbi:MAG: hypothetical protein ACP5RI_03935 [Candidatus Micrarchaeia archaeon]